jgi:hypothetical protein
MADQRRIIEVVLQARNELSRVLQSAGRDVSSFGRAVGTVGTGLSILGAAGVAAVAGAVATTVRFGDAMRDLSQRTGIGVESLSALKFVADQSGASIDSVAQSMKFLSVHAFSASRGSEEAEKAFKSLGVRLMGTGGTLRTTEELFLDTVDALGRVDNEVQRAALTVQLFGRSGLEMSELTRLGRDEIVRLSEEARRLGLTISQDAANQADEFSDSLSALKASVGGLTRTIVTDLIPTLTPLVDRLRETVAGVTSWVRENPRLAESILGVSAALAAGGGIVAVLTKLSSLFPALAAAAGPVGVAFGVIASALVLVQKNADLTRTAIENFQQAAALAAAGPAAEQPTTGLTVSLEAAIRSVEIAIEEAKSLNQDTSALTEQLERLRAQASQEFDAAVRGRNVTGRPAIGTLGLIAPSELTDLARGTLAQMEEVRRQAAGLPSAVPVEPQADVVAAAGEFGRAGVEASQRVGSSLTGALTNFIATGQSGFASLGSFARGVLADIAAAFADIGFRQLLGFFIPGFQAGGIVRGGLGGSDSVLAALTPGEAVIPRDLTRRLDRALAGGSPAGQINVNINAGAFLGDNGQALELGRKIQRILDESLTGRKF